jgi:hypothetical protein
MQRFDNAILSSGFLVIIFVMLDVCDFREPRNQVKLVIYSRVVVSVGMVVFGVTFMSAMSSSLPASLALMLMVSMWGLRLEVRAI